MQILWKLSHFTEPINLESIPTIGFWSSHNEFLTQGLGFHVETFFYKGMKIAAWDLAHGGRSNMRTFWHHYYENTEGIVFVVDAADHNRIHDAVDELNRLLVEDQLLGVPILIFLNKTDLSPLLSSEEFYKLSKLDSTPRKHHICESIATTGVGLHKGMNWLYDAMKRKDSFW
jgi:ADP-ribosylation factor 1/2